MTKVVPVPITRQDSFTDLTAHAVRELILGGHFQPGERVNEVELARSLGVSRGPLREALNQLSAEGLVLRIQHRGTFIPEFGAGEALELYQVRQALESTAARLLAESGEAQSAAERLTALLETTRSRLDNMLESPYPVDLEFHEVLVGLSGNQRLAQHAGEVRRQLHFALSSSAYKPDRARTAYEEHVEIVRAIADGDGDAADRAMRLHLSHGFEHVRQIFQHELSAGSGSGSEGSHPH